MAALLRVRNKPKLGWQVKTRNEREIPLPSVLVGILRHVVGSRTTGPVFRQRRFDPDGGALLAGTKQHLERV